MLLNPQGPFKAFLNYVENTRATINFPEEDIKLIDIEIIKSKPNVLNVDSKEIYRAEKDLIDLLNKIKREAPKYQQSDISDIIYRVNEFGKFMDVIKKHAVKGIATQLYFSMKEPYLLFLKMAKEKLRDNTSYPINNLLEIIGNVMNDMSSYFGNIFHCNLGFFEERGFYNNIIGLASNVELAYNKYANCICEAIMSDEERNVDKLEICCSVTSDKEPLICTHDLFEHISQPEQEISSLVNVNIPVSYVFKYDFVSRVIIHEIAHHVGDRKRKERVYAICSVFASVIVDPIVQAFAHALNSKAKKEEKRVLDEFEKTNGYKEIHDKMVEQVFLYIEEYVTSSVITICNNNFFMNKVVDAIVETINTLSCDSNLIEKLSGVIVDYNFWYYELFEDFYLQNYPKTKYTVSFITEISEYAIKDYNSLYVRKMLEELFSELVETKQSGSHVAALAERCCCIYLPDLENFIGVFFNAVSEAFCDISMITLSNMTFKEYLQLMAGYGKKIQDIIDGNDYLTWIRINFIANYMGEKLPYSRKLPERFKYFEDLNIFKLMDPYFNSLKPGFKVAYKRCRDNKLLATFLDGISSNNEEKHLSAIFNMFFGIAES